MQPLSGVLLLSPGTRGDTRLLHIGWRWGISTLEKAQTMLAVGPSPALRPWEGSAWCYGSSTLPLTVLGQMLCCSSLLTEGSGLPGLGQAWGRSQEGALGETKAPVARLGRLRPVERKGATGWERV